MRPFPDVDPGRLDALFDRFPHQLWIADGDGRLARVNRQLADYFGPRLEAGWCSLPELVVAEDRPRVLEAWAAARVRGEGFQVEARMPAADGQIRWFLIAASPLPETGRDQAGWCGTNTDIDEAHTVRSNLERALQMQQRALATANHDLRQPLSAIIFLIAALQQRASEETDRRMLEAIGNAAHTMRVMVDNQLDFMRLNTDTLHVTLADVPVNGLLTRLAIEFSPLAAAKGLSFSVHPCSCVIRTDRHLLERMLRNLLLNAVRYTRSGRVVLGCRRRGRDLRIEVLDTGRGIEESERCLVTEPFYRSARSTLEYPGGLGLGLAVVERIAALLGHELRLDSQAGRGTAVALTAPLSEMPAAPPAPARTHGRRVLLVPGDEPIQPDIFRNLGCQVDVLEEDAGVWDPSASGEQPDLIVCGLIHAAAADGVLRLRRLLASAGGNARGLLMTAATEPVRLREMLLSGYPFLCLPISSHELEVKLVDVLLKHR